VAPLRPVPAGSPVLSTKLLQPPHRWRALPALMWQLESTAIDHGTLGNLLPIGKSQIAAVVSVLYCKLVCIPSEAACKHGVYLRSCPVLYIMMPLPQWPALPHQMLTPQHLTATALMCRMPSCTRSKLAGRRGPHAPSAAC
jgi:hypothetical protein